MIEKTILNYIETALNGVPVGLERDDLAGRFVIIQKTGASVHNHINRVTFAFQSYDDTLYNTQNLTIP